MRFNRGKRIGMGFPCGGNLDHEFGLAEFNRGDPALVLVAGRGDGRDATFGGFPLVTKIAQPGG